MTIGGVGKAVTSQFYMAIRAKSYAVQWVLKLDVAVSIDDVLTFVTDAGRTVTKDPNAEEGPLFYSAETVCPADTIDAVMRILSSY